MVTPSFTENINHGSCRPVKSALIIKALVSHKATSGGNHETAPDKHCRRKSVSLASRPFVKGLCSVSDSDSGNQVFAKRFSSVPFSDSGGVH